jgi:hypothetical protein
LRGNEVSDAFNHTRMGVFMKNMLPSFPQSGFGAGLR